MTSRFATLTFEQQSSAPVETLWHAWTAPAARATWASPAPGVTVSFLAGQPDIRCEVSWLDLAPATRSVNAELVATDGAPQSAALVTADFTPDGTGSRLAVTVQLASLAADMEPGYRAGFSAALENVAGVAERTMILQRTIRAPRHLVWGAWTNPETLPKWWGPDGFFCRTQRIDLRTGGEWLFDMIAPDGTVFPNHHLYGEVRPEDRIGYTLLWGENGPKHADAWAAFEDAEGATQVTLGMVFSTAAEFQTALGFGAPELGQQTLAKLACFVGAE